MIQRSALLVLSGAILLAGCGQTPSSSAATSAPTATSPEQKQPANLREVYRQQQAELGLKPGDDLMVIDVQTGQTYSEPDGFGKTHISAVDANGVTTLSNGQKLNLPMESKYPGLSAQAVGPGCESTAYCPFTRVESGSGYRKTQATLILPTSQVTGLDAAGEAVYNYVGLRNPALPPSNVETGFYVYANNPSTWRAYIRYKNADNTEGFAGEFIPAGETTASAIAFGTTISVLMYASADGQVTFQYSYGGATHTKVFSNIYGVVQNGASQYARYVSSLLLDSAGSVSLEKWRSGTFSTTTTSAAATTSNSTLVKGGYGTNTSTPINPNYDIDVTLKTP